jgi:uncharacterized protein
MKKLIFLVLAVILSVNIFAADIPERPNPPTLVTDMANVFSNDQRSQLERKLVDFFAATSTQIAVVTVNDLQGSEPSDFAFQLGEKWGIGSEKFDNGILVLVKPKTGESRGQVFIAVGYGLEGVVPDATSKQIVENEMIPQFKAGDMFAGVDNATNVLIDLTKGEYNYQQYTKKSAKGSGGFAVFIILIIIFSLVFRRRKGYYAAGNKSSLPFWLALGMLSGNRHNHSGFFDDFSSGSGSFGGGGSSFGGFGGFGGGSFGGGGAGGSW